MYPSMCNPCIDIHIGNNVQDEFDYLAYKRKISTISVYLLAAVDVTHYGFSFQVSWTKIESKSYSFMGSIHTQWLCIVLGHVTIFRACWLGLNLPMLFAVELLI